MLCGSVLAADCQWQVVLKPSLPKQRGVEEPARPGDEHCPLMRVSVRCIVMGPGPVHPLRFHTLLLCWGLLFFDTVMDSSLTWTCHASSSGLTSYHLGFHGELRTWAQHWTIHHEFPAGPFLSCLEPCAGCGVCAYQIVAPFQSFTLASSAPSHSPHLPRGRMLH